MATVIKRVKDGALLPAFSSTKLQVNSDAFGSSRSFDSVLGPLGEAIPIGNVLDSKMFSLTWVSSDTTGIDQARLRNFFSDSGYYVITSTEFGLDSVWASVLDIDSPWTNVTINFQSRFGDLMKQQSTVLNSQTISSGASAAWSGSYTNNTDVDVKIQLTLEANTNAVWKAGTAVTLSQLAFVIASQDDYGQWIVTQKRKSIILDSSRLVVGEGYFRPTATQFYRVRPGETKKLTLASIANPFTTAQGWTLTLEALATGQAG